MTHDGEAFWQTTPPVRALWTGPDAQTTRPRGRPCRDHAARLMLPVGAQGAPLAPAIIWPDRRVAHAAAAWAPWWRAAFRVIGMRHTLERLQTRPNSTGGPSTSPPCTPRHTQVPLLSGLLHQRLTGRFVDSVGAQVAYPPFDYKRHAWCRFGLACKRWRCGRRSCRVVPVGQPLGTLSLDAAAPPACRRLAGHRLGRQSLRGASAPARCSRTSGR